MRENAEAALTSADAGRPTAAIPSRTHRQEGTTQCVISTSEEAKSAARAPRKFDFHLESAEIASATSLVARALSLFLFITTLTGRRAVAN